MSGAVITAGNRKVPETDVGYANARLRGMRSHLLPKSFYERLIEASDLGQVIKELMDTAYGPDLEEQLVHGHTAAVIDDALKANMIYAYQKVLKFLHPDARKLLSTLLGRWDAFNLKTILRGAHFHVGFEEMKSSFFPVGYLSLEELEALAKFDDVRVIIDTMAMWGYVYAVPLRRAYPEYAKSNDLAALELALDRQYAEWAASRLVGECMSVDVARQVLGMQVDTSNLVMVFRLLKADAEQPRRRELLPRWRARHPKEAVPGDVEAFRRRRSDRLSQAHAVFRGAGQRSIALPRERFDPGVRAGT